MMGSYFGKTGQRRDHVGKDLNEAREGAGKKCRGDTSFLG